MSKLFNKTYTQVEQTIKSTKNLLDTENRCCVIRPTGFGKTFMAFDISKSYNCLIFIYPRDIIKEDILNKYDNNKSDTTLVLLSYMKLLNMYKDESMSTGILPLLNNEKTLIVFDEAHLACAENTIDAVRALMTIMNKSKILGLTATPERADGKNPVTDLFEGREVFRYTLSDAIRDGVFNKPHYIRGSFEIDEDLRNIKKRISNISNMSEDDTKTIDSELIRLGNLDVSHVLKKYLQELVEDKDYMKIMIFYPNISILENKYMEIVKIFEDIFPDYTINPLVIHSRGENNLDELPDLSYHKNKIDLIISVDMLNLGYHIDDITAIIMNRPTFSNVIYKQQIGRGINISSHIEPIIFDFVGNWARKQYGGSTITESEDKPKESDNLIEDTFGEGNIIFHDETVDMNKLERVISKYSTPEEEKKNILLIVHAFLFLGAPIDFCMSQLKRDKTRFLELVEDYRDYFDNEGNRIK